MSFIKLTVGGQIGLHGASVRRHVAEDSKRELARVRTLFHKEGQIVLEQAMNNRTAIPKDVQV